MASDIEKPGGRGQRYPIKPTYSYRNRSNLSLLLSALGLVALYTAVTRIFGIHISWLPESGRNWSDTIDNIRRLQLQLRERWPRSNFGTYRDNTLHSLDRLASCMAARTCGSGETTVVILGSFHFGNSQTGHTSGEDIWAGSLIKILQSHNFTLLYTYFPLETLLVHKAVGDLVPLIFMEAAGSEQCASIGKLSRELASSQKPAIEGLQWIPPEEPLGCAKRIGYEGGIPMQKVRSLHFWHGQRHPLPGWTLSPENYSGWHGDTGSYYLGYHLDHCIGRRSLPHTPRAFVLGKRPTYFDDEHYAWPRGGLAKVAEGIGNGFEFVGGAGGAKGVVFETGIRNLGSMGREKWESEVAASAAMLGIGNPPLSPSPYDALCMGVPFINPILWRHPKETTVAEHWRTQHQSLKDFGPPYVYHVYKENTTELREAIQAAIDNPIEPFIPERMKRENVEQRLMHLVNHNWTAEAEKLIFEGKVQGYARHDGQNMQDGLLL